VIKLKANMNYQILNQVNFDSGSISVLSSVIHKFSEPELYIGSVHRGKDVVGRFRIEVKNTLVAKSKPNQSEKEASSAEKILSISKSQVHIDLKRLDVPIDRHLENEIHNRYELVKDSYAVFYVSSGHGEYSVELCRIGKDSKPIIEFNSRILQKNDLFNAIIMRPGIYSVKNTKNNAEGELTVAYPERGKLPREQQPVSIECNKQFVPGKIEINPTQGLVFNFKVPSRIKIELIKLDEKFDPIHKPKNRKSSIKKPQTAK